MVKADTWKLIKDYPGANLKIGDVWEIAENAKTHYFPKDYPEFWEKVVEKDYKIISISGHGGLYTIKNNDKFAYYELSKNGKYTSDFLLNNCGKPYHIHSIKRLSDGMIFSIGDKFYPNKDEAITGTIIDTIIKFELIENNALLRIQGDNFCRNIDNIVKYKELLFVTEDNVEIFKGDEYCCLYTNYTIGSMLTTNNASGKFTGIKRFSTKEAANKYIEENKPMYSKIDILSVLDYTTKKLLNYNYTKFLEIFKEKLYNNEN